MVRKRSWPAVSHCVSKERADQHPENEEDEYEEETGRGGAEGENEVEATYDLELDALTVHLDGANFLLRPQQQ